MIRPLRHSVGCRRGAVRRHLLILALVFAARIAASLMPMPSADAGAADPVILALGLAGDAICHAGARSGDPSGPVPGKSPAGPTHACDICPICHVLATAALPPPVGPVLARAAGAAGIGASPMPVSRAAPAPLVIATGPRGPPTAIG